MSRPPLSKLSGAEPVSFPLFLLPVSFFGENSEEFQEFRVTLKEVPGGGGRYIVERNTLYLSVNAFSTKVLIGTLFLTSSTSGLFQAFR